MDGRQTGTRRDVLGSIGAVAAGSIALAGCVGESTEDDPSNGDSEPTATPDGGETTTPKSTSYEVTMAPVGSVTFESVPESWSTYFPGYAEMGIALGQADGLTAVGNAGRFHVDHLAELDGVSVNKDELTQLIGDSGIDKELYYSLGNDVHLTDPEWLTSNDFFGLASDDIDELTNNVGPFVGNTIFRRTDGWHDYRYYTMYEAFAKVAQVFQQTDRYEAFASFHDEVLATVQADLPPATERPNALLCFAASNEPEKFSPYRLTDKGTNKKHFRDLGIEDALAGSGVEGLSESNRGKIDYETMLEVDPEYLFVRGHETKSAEKFADTVLAFMKEHSVASELTAVQNGDVYRGGAIYQGPIRHLFQLERVATQVYPDVYDGKLFDRAKLSATVRGEA